MLICVVYVENKEDRSLIVDWIILFFKKDLEDWNCFLIGNF